MCPVMRKRRSVQRHYVFFTLNGKFLGAAFCCHGLDSVLPFVAFQDYVLPVRINFGKQPFVFDLNTLCEDDIIERCKVSSSERVLDEGPDSDDDDSILSQDSDDESDRTDHTPDFCSDDDRDWVCDCGDSQCENSVPPPHRRRTNWESDDHSEEDEDRYWCEECQTYHYNDGRDGDDDDDDEDVEGRHMITLDFEDMMRIALIESMKDAVARREAEEKEEEDDERMEGVPTPREGETIRFRSKPTSE